MPNQVRARESRVGSGGTGSSPKHSGRLHERHRFEESLDLAEPQVRELHRALALRGRRALAGEKDGPVGRAEDRVQWSGVQAVQRGEHLAGFTGNPVLVRSRDGRPGRGQLGARELRHEHVTPAVLVLVVGNELGRGDGQPAAEVIQHPRLGDAVRRGHRGVELENAAVTDRVNGSGAALVTAECGTRQTEAGREIFRGGPDGLLVEDDGLPLLVRTYSGQHAREVPRVACRRQLNFRRFGHTPRQLGWPKPEALGYWTGRRIHRHSGWPTVRFCRRARRPARSVSGRRRICRWHGT